jgi:hypothetical protein
MIIMQYIPDFFVAEHYGFKNTFSWGSKDLFSGIAYENYAWRKEVKRISDTRCLCSRFVQKLQLTPANYFLKNMVSTEVICLLSPE